MLSILNFRQNQCQNFDPKFYPYVLMSIFDKLRVLTTVQHDLVQMKIWFPCIVASQLRKGHFVI